MILTSEQMPKLSDLRNIVFEGCLGECGVYILQAMVGNRRATQEELDHIEAHEMRAIREKAERYWEGGE